MENKNTKRSRSAGSDNDDTNNNPIQRKVWVSEKMSEANDPEKMQEVHEKTTKMLFDGAAAVEEAEVAAASEDKPMALHEQYQLLGDGNIQIRDLTPDLVNPSLEFQQSRCCQRNTFIQDECANCSGDLCEECGYSCTECYKFLCRSCVTVFENCSDNPLCERCQMFFA